MDPEIKRLWVEALRSGKYRQHTRFLADMAQTKFCCLGVLNYKVDRKEDPETIFTHGAFEEAFLTVFGIPEDQSLALARMNDSGSTFAEIADYIERTL